MFPIPAPKKLIVRNDKVAEHIIGKFPVKAAFATVVSINYTQPVEISVGDSVFYHWNSSYDFEIDGIQYVILSCSDVLGVSKKPKGEQ